MSGRSECELDKDCEWEYWVHVYTMRCKSISGGYSMWVL